jgi:hypothetical protein
MTLRRRFRIATFDRLCLRPPHFAFRRPWAFWRTVYVLAGKLRVID